MGTIALTGSAGGIGGGIRSRLEAAGHTVIGIDLQGAEVEADLSSADGRRAAVEAVAERCGGTLDGAVACAGIGGTVEPSSLVGRVNYFGAVEFLDGCFELLKTTEGASAVAVSSNSAGLVPPDKLPLVDAFLAGDEEEAARLSDDEDGYTVYAASKLALARAVRRRVAEWGEAGVRLNAVAPGPVHTKLLQDTIDHPVYGPLVRDFPVPLDRWGTPEEIGDAVVFLLTHPWIHGSILFVDGGTDALMRADAV